MVESREISFFGEKRKIQVFTPDTLFQDLLAAENGAIFMLNGETAIQVFKLDATGRRYYGSAK